MSNMTIEQLVGETLLTVEVNHANDEIIFQTESGRRFKMYHSQDCCESVYVEDICGDLEDLIGSPVLVAVEAQSDEQEINGGYSVWTFYKLDTAKGGVTIRWCGSSNGHYSVAVSFIEEG